MTNQEVANLLRQIAKILEIKGDSTFRIRAYEEAATRVENLAEPIEDIGSVVSLQCSRYWRKHSCEN